MNKAILIGNLGKDIELRYTDSNMAVGRFSIALNRGKDKDGNDKGTDWVSCVAFGKSAETMSKYLGKGSKVAIEGHIQTGSYEKDGHKVYTTDIIVDRFEFVGSRNDANTSSGASHNGQMPQQYNVPEGFSEVVVCFRCLGS